MPITTYCTWRDIEHRLSIDGADATVDDDIDDTERTKVLEDAATEVNGYCQLLYSIEALADSEWISKKTKDIAVYYAFTRRGNPAPGSVEHAYDKAIKDLERVQLSITVIPDAAQRKSNVPVLSNLRAAKYPVNGVKVVRGKSTGTPEGYVQHEDRTSEGIDYSI